LQISCGELHSIHKPVSAQGMAASWHLGLR
jgi:hypothetical protein